MYVSSFVEDHLNVANALKLVLEAEGIEVSGPVGTAAGQLRDCLDATLGRFFRVVKLALPLQAGGLAQQSLLMKELLRQFLRPPQPIVSLPLWPDRQR
jgi:hypothetical protein